MKIQKEGGDLGTKVLRDQRFTNYIIDKWLIPLLEIDKKNRTSDSPGSLMVKTPCSQCRGHRFNPWSGN